MYRFSLFGPLLPCEIRELMTLVEAIPVYVYLLKLTVSSSRRYETGFFIYYLDFFSLLLKNYFVLPCYSKTPSASSCCSFKNLRILPQKWTYVYFYYFFFCYSPTPLQYLKDTPFRIEWPITMYIAQYGILLVSYLLFLRLI